MKEINFNGKTIVITGGATGIGFVIAKTFSQLGANVVICGRKESKLKKAEESLVNSRNIIQKKIMSVVCDMSQEIEVTLLIDKILQKFFSVDVFINNAGVWSLMSILELTGEDIDYAYNNILKSTIIGTKIAASAMNKNGGSIINIGSFAGLLAQKHASLYACFKTAIVSFTKSAAAELAEQNIRVNCVTPGVIRTPMTDDYINENYQRLIQPISLKRIGMAEEVANGVVFFASEYSSYITGENLCITGGKYLIQGESVNEKI